MKILQLTNKIPYPPSDGGVIAVLSLSLGLANLGHEVTVLSMTTEKHNFDARQIPEEFSSKIKFESVKVSANITPIGLITNYLFSKTPYTASRFISQNYANKLSDLLKSTNYDIVQLEGLYLAPYIHLIKKLCSAPIVMRAHNVENEIWERVRENTSNPIKKMYLKNLNRKLKKFESQFLTDYDLLLPITDRDGEQFKKLGYKNTLYTLPTGIESSRYHHDKSLTEYPSVFHLGSMDWEPNLEGLKWFLEHVWAKVIDKSPDLKFFIAGRNASEATKKYFQNYPNVVFDGEVENANAYINSKAIMIVPLLSGSGMRIKVIEGMALSKAIVSTSIGMEGINVENGKNAIITDSPQSFADAILELIENKERYDAMCKNARLFIENNFDNTNIVKKLCDVYRNTSKHTVKSS